MAEDVTRGKNEKCLICLKKFTLFNPEHICKRCLRSVCKDCANTKALIFQKSGQKKPHRLCSKCMPEAEFLTNYKAAYNISFGVNCKIGGSWAEHLHKMSQSKTKDLPRIKKPPLRSKTEFWQSLNFSLKNFFGLCSEGTDYYPMLKQLYERCQLRCSEYVCMFFLCHLNEPKSLESVYAIHGLVNEQPPQIENVLANFKYFGCSSKDIAGLKPFTEYIFPKFVEHVSLNVLTAEISLYILAAIIKERSARVLEKGLSASIFAVKDFVIRYGQTNRKAVENQLVLNVRFNQFQTNIKILSEKDKLEAETVRVRNASIVRETSSVSMLETPYTKQPSQVEVSPNKLSESTENIARSQSLVQPQQISRTIQVPAENIRSSGDHEFSKQRVKSPQPEYDASSQPSDHANEDSMENSGGSGLRKLSIDNEDFDEDLRRLYDHNQQMLQQAKALKKLSEQLLKQIEQM